MSENKNTRIAIDDDILDQVAGGNDDVKGKGTTEYYTCKYCGQTFPIKQEQDKAKHMTQDCPVIKALRDQQK